MGDPDTVGIHFLEVFSPVVQFVLLNIEGRVEVVEEVLLSSSRFVEILLPYFDTCWAGVVVVGVVIHGLW